MNDQPFLVSISLSTIDLSLQMCILVIIMCLFKLKHDGVGCSHFIRCMAEMTTKRRWGNLFDNAPLGQGHFTTLLTHFLVPCQYSFLLAYSRICDAAQANGWANIIQLNQVKLLLESLHEQTEGCIPGWSSRVVNPFLLEESPVLTMH